MENLLIDNPVLQTKASEAFIEANTTSVSLHDMMTSHIIPVFTKDNEPLISHTDFISIAEEVSSIVFRDEVIIPANIRVSHPIKGRIPDAKDKPANQLLEKEKTIYYERMMFLIEIPSIRETIDGNTLNLTIGGVKSYTQDNLYNRKGSDEHFKIFIGFKNQVCTNLCVSTDGLQANVKVKNAMQLMQEIQKLITDFRFEKQLEMLKQFPSYSLSEHQFATLVGKCKLYQYLPVSDKKDLPILSFGDYQISAIAKDYYTDQSFCRKPDGSINLWKVYNLFTGANKSSYIDGFLPRSANASSFVSDLVNTMDSGNTSWFLN
ncbi:DUF3871 family protein [Dyadobacter sp. CY345]|uniref:DUF3871 family protein n=1 Tax=Dyadobacter sp. CY345 TaxID=2909335 RepID=UPI001F2B4689|nr:DUF3871 family protein [Dyadobacter sp. CY345]MCF2446219.1 DUF3871 family protein [Dyadobacter sp. CY345]